MNKQSMSFIKIFKSLLIILGILFVCLFGFWVFIADLFGAHDKQYTPDELIDNFSKKRKEIYELKAYFNQVAPKNRDIEIEFDGNNKLSRFGIRALDTTAGDPYGPQFLEWDIPINSKHLDSAITPLGWNRQTLKTLKSKLDNANCIAIESGEPAKIGFQRSGMGMYFFNVFNNPIPDSLVKQYNDSCRYIFANKNLVLEYGGGAIGPQCFYPRSH